MSQENVEIAREGWRAYREQGIDGSLDYFADDCVCENLPEGPDSATTFEGWEGVRERNELFTEIWGDLVLEPVEFIDAGEEVVVIVVSMRGRGKGSGAPVEASIAFVTEFRDGKIVRDRPFPSRAKALEAAGLKD